MGIHIAKKHKVIEQIDGHNSDDEDLYAESYWEREFMRTSYHSYLDALQNIKTSNLSSKEKNEEYQRVKEARKEAFLNDGWTVREIERSIPPWSS